MKIKLLNLNKDNEDIEDSSLFINKKSYFKYIVLLKIIIALFYAFSLGYNSFYFGGEDFISYGIKFAILLFIIYLFIDIPYNLFKVILLPNFLKGDDMIIYINPFNLSIDLCFKKEINKNYLILVNIITIILFSFTPNLLLIINGFNFYTYAFASASAIFIVKDLIYTILLIIYNENKITSTPYFFKNKSK